MEEEELARAPLRARILASINPYASASPPRKVKHGDSNDDDDDGNGNGNGKGPGNDDGLSDRKSSHNNSDEPTRRYRHHHHRHRHHHRRHHQSRSRSRSRSRSQSPRAHDTARRHHRHHRHHRRRHRSSTKDAEEEPEDPYAERLDPDAAFRQSLFDAMADDEGAAYWEAVYGQPVHEYAREAKASHAGRGGGGGDGNGDDIHAMDDEAYAAYVRQKMWERSDAGRREAREAEKRRREAEARQAEKDAAAQQKAEADRRAWAAAVDRSLRHGAARRQRRQTWQARWDAYVAAWAAWDASPAVERIPWPGERSEPVPASARKPEADETGGRDATDKEGADKEADNSALVQAARDLFTGPHDHPPSEAALRSRLRDERVRWHPDKMQQRLGGSVDGAAMRDITAVFQVVDSLWGSLRR